MNRRAVVPLVVGLGVGLLAVKFAFDTIRKAKASGEARQVVTVVRAKQDIAAHEEIQKEMVETVETPENLFAPAAERMDKVETAVGRVAAKPISKNSPVLLSMLAPPGTRPGMVGRIPPGYRAVSVKIDEVSGVAYQMQPGDWVDVIVVMDIESGTKGKKETMAEVILQHIQVAAIGYGTNPEADSAAQKTRPAKSATLLVPEEEVPKLHLAGTRGKITLAMRGEEDKTQNRPAVAYGNEIMKGSGIDTPPAPAADAQTPTKPSAADGQPRPSKDRTADRYPPEEPDPHMVLVFHGVTQTKEPTLVEQITFVSAKSSQIMAMAQGAPTQASATMSGSKERGLNRPTRAGSEPKVPADHAGNEEPGTGDAVEVEENKHQPGAE